MLQKFQSLAFIDLILNNLTGNSQNLKVSFKQWAIDLKTQKIIQDTSDYWIIAPEKAIQVYENQNMKPSGLLLIDKSKQARRKLIYKSPQNGKPSAWEIADGTEWIKTNEASQQKESEVAASQNLKWIYSDKTQTIGNYACKQLLLCDGTDTTTVWYTESIAFNWLFDNIFAQVPGTVVWAFNRSNTLITLNGVDTQNHSLEQHHIEVSLVLSKWNKQF